MPKRPLLPSEPALAQLDGMFPVALPKLDELGFGLVRKETKLSPEY